MTDMFSKRSEEVEIMDDLLCSGEVVDQTLNELDNINKWLGGNDVTINALNQLLKKTEKDKIISVADLGCGSGEMLKLIERWARRNNHSLSLSGVDANPNIISYARSHLIEHPNIKLLSLNIFEEEFKQHRFDVAVSTLFFHHFSSNQLINFFKQLKDQVNLGFIINDIHRHRFAYYSIRLITKIFSRSHMVKYDAPLSVLRAFTKNELESILMSAGIKNYQIRWRWAFRWQVVVYA